MRITHGGTFWRQTRKSTVDIGGRSPCCLRLEAASDVQECLATLRSLTSRRTEAQRRAMPLRPGAFPFRSPCSEALACGDRAEGDSSVREERRRGIAVSAQWVVASSERQTAAPPPHPPPRCRFFLLFFVCFACFSFLVLLAGFSFLVLLAGFSFLVLLAEEELADENFSLHCRFFLDNT